jgi:hypothetical protein
MFENTEMTEAKTGRVNVKEFDSCVVKALVQFAYTGKVAEFLLFLIVLTINKQQINCNINKNLVDIYLIIYHSKLKCSRLNIILKIRRRIWIIWIWACWS